MTGLIVLYLYIGIATVILNGEDMPYNDLNSEEKRVIVHKGTEKPFSGKYNQHKEKGTYLCKRCNTPLYRSDDKFDSQCGWPSFDDEITGAVKHQLDADGTRTEITCTNCGAHLGHLFTGEGFTPKNIRHCVNSISLNFVSSEESLHTQTAFFAGGCFWGTEYFFQKPDGVISTRVGYMGGHKKNPTYREVCNESTGHAETIEVVYDSTKVSFESLAKLFFEIHDPTQVNRQGPDIGSQYRSAIFYVDEQQKKTAKKLIKNLEDKGFRIATELAPAGTFWEAEKYHQNYYLNNGEQPYCHSYKKRF